MNTKQMTWEEMVNTYPDQWVVVKDAVLNGPDIISGDVIDVKSDDEIIAFRTANQKKGYEYRRTTEGFFNGITGSSVVISIE